MYHIPRDILFAGLTELRRLYAVHLLQPLDDDGLAAWFLDIWVFTIYSGPDPGSAVGWTNLLANANLLMRRAMQQQVPTPPGEPWPVDPP